MSNPEATDPIADAQHDETGRMWRGPLSQLPCRFSVVPVTELQALRAENARLREALDTIGFAPSGWGGPGLNECILIARKALEVKQ
jgi:hypothetical protein